MVLIALAGGIAIIAATAALTLWSWDRLPERVPIHFGINGVADSFAPRAAIWLLVVLQVVIAAAFVAIYSSGRDRGLLLFGCSVLAVCAWAQVEIISAATSGTNRIRTLRFWGGFAAIFVAGIIAAQLVQ
ncbi:MAG: DUF1648 domain-containing protein [Candidatus Cybelea sp.]